VNGHVGERRKLVLLNWWHKAMLHAHRAAATDTVARLLSALRAVPDLGEVMVREGYAVNFAIDYGGYPVAEREAQSARAGIWQGDFERPKDWRRRDPRTG
jgi:endonuclease YncB( thermonuclease family)